MGSNMFTNINMIDNNKKAIMLLLKQFNTTVKQIRNRENWIIPK